MKDFWQGFEKRAMGGADFSYEAIYRHIANKPVSQRLKDGAYYGGLGAAAGAIIGGEKGEDGKFKNRRIGALRGTAAGLGASAGVQGMAHFGHPLIGRAIDKGKLRNPQSIHFLQQGSNLGAALAGGYLGYKAMKAFGPKYDREKMTGAKK